MNKIRRGGLCILVVLAFAGILLSQTGTSRIAGIVTDPSGAVLSGAKVTATNEGTNISWTTTTSAAGSYSFESMVPGAYTIAVAATGFKAFVSTGNVLTIGQPMTVNAKLEVGAINEKVTVVGTAEAVQTSTSGNFGNLEDQIAVTELPIVGVRGRNPLDLVNFQPGVVVGSNAGGGIHVHGSRDRSWNYTLDGVDMNETSAPGSGFTPTRMNPDMLAEMRVVTGNATADTGRATGGDVAMVSRNGTNEYHGNAFFFYQTPGLDANEVANKIVTPPLGRNMFVQKIGGFSLGGPLRKNHTFFFGNFQFLRTLRTAKVTRAVLTREARAGQFRYLDCTANPGCPQNSPAGAGGTVDLQGNPIPGLVIDTYDIAANDPQQRGLDPSIQSFIGLTPPPNDFTVGDGLNVAGYSWTPAEMERQEDYMVRLDQSFNDQHAVFVRFNWGHQNTDGDIVNAGQPPFPGTVNWVNTERTPRNLGINWRWTPNTRSTNELVLGMNRFTFNFNNGDPNVAKNPPYMLNYMFGFDPGGCFPPCDLPLHNDAGNLRALTTYQLTDNFSFAKGAHTFRWGGQVLYQRHIDDRGSVGIYNANPAVYFDTNTNPVDGTTFNMPESDVAINEYDFSNAQGMINDLLGRVGAIDEGFVAANKNQWAPVGQWFNFDSRFPEYDLYAQDTWKVKSNLTIDAGLRWEIRMAPNNPHNQLLQPDHAMIYGSSPSDTINWTPGNLYKNQWKNFGPSIGFAWDPFKDQKTSIRANYRLAYDRINTFVISSYIIQNLPGQTYSYENTTFGEGGGRLQDGLPPLAPPAGITPASLRTPPPFSTNWTTVMDPNMTTPRTHMWGLSVQHELPHKLTMELNYIGRHGSHLFGGYDANTYQIFKNGFLSAFQALQAGQDSPLIDQLLAGYPWLGGETGSQFIMDNFGSRLSQNSIGPVAKFINEATDENGNQLIGPYNIDGNTTNNQYFFNNFPQFADEVDTLDTHDWSNYHGFEAQLQRRFSNGLQFQASYTFAKSLDTRSYDPTFTTVPTGSSYQSSTSVPWDYAHRHWNYARSDFDRRHALQGDWVWDLPVGRGKLLFGNANRVADRIVGGWRLSGVFTLQSGRPFTVFSGSYTYSDSVQTPASCNGCSPGMGHLQWVGGAPYSPDASLLYFSPDQQAKFYQPAAGQMSNIGRNYFNLPHNFNVDMAVAKTFNITEKQNLEMRLEIQNLTNSVMYDLPYSSRFTSGMFGYMAGQTFNSSRKMQLAAKYTF